MSKGEARCCPNQTSWMCVYTRLMSPDLRHLGTAFPLLRRTEKAHHSCGIPSKRHDLSPARRRHPMSPTTGQLSRTLQRYQHHGSQRKTEGRSQRRRDNKMQRGVPAWIPRLKRGVREPRWHSCEVYGLVNGSVPILNFLVVILYHSHVRE